MIFSFYKKTDKRNGILGSNQNFQLVQLKKYDFCESEIIPPVKREKEMGLF